MNFMEPVHEGLVLLAGILYIWKHRLLGDNNIKHVGPDYNVSGIHNFSSPATTNIFRVQGVVIFRSHQATLTQKVCFLLDRGMIGKRRPSTRGFNQHNS